MKSAHIFLLRTEFISDTPDSRSWGIRTTSSVVFTRKKRDYQLHLKKKLRTVFGIIMYNGFV